MVDRAPGSGEGRSAAPTLRGGGGSGTSPRRQETPGQVPPRGPRSAARSRGTPGSVVPGRGGRGGEGGGGRKGERERAGEEAWNPERTGAARGAVPGGGGAMGRRAGWRTEFLQKMLVAQI